MVTYRAMSAADASSFLSAVRDSASHLLPWVTTPWRVHDLATAAQAASILLSNGLSARYGLFDEAELLGSVRLIELSAEVPDYEIGIWCVRSASGRGLSSWLLGKAICSAFDSGAQRVTVRHAATNVRAERMVSRLKLKCEGTIRRGIRVGDRLDDLLTYGILPEELMAEWSRAWGESS